MTDRKLNFFNVGVLYVGTIMGAGFASGRESWQFFGVFGPKGYIGVVLAGVLFVCVGMMVSYIARNLGTDDIGKVVVPWNNKVLSEIVGYLIAGILYIVIIYMSAAGGALLNQQFGLNNMIGAGVVIALVIVTVLGNFDRMAKIFKLVIPILFVVVIICCIIVLFSDIGQSGATSGYKPSELAPVWPLSAILFVSYNIFGMISVTAAASLNAKNKKHAIFGSAVGGIMLGTVTLALVLALNKDMAFTDSMDLPMLAFSERISPLVNIAFAVVLFAAIYAAAASTYYGFSTKIPESPRKKYYLIIGALAGFIGGITGFKSLVTYLYPFEGYLGIGFIAMITLNFFRVYRKKHSMKNQFDSDIYVNFDGHDRFAYPDNMARVTAGYGGEAILIFGSEKTVLYDCGMAYCHQGVTDNIAKALTEHGRDGLDCILISHTHYDHIGAMPYILQKWPDAKVYGAAKAKSVFESSGAAATMKRLGEAARDNFSDSKEPLTAKGMRIDIIVKDGDEIPIGGGQYFHVMEAKGHTDCSLVYILEPDKIMFTSESTGVMRNPEYMSTAILKSYKDTVDTAQRCKDYGAKQLIGAHYGILPEGFVDEYFDLYLKFARDEKEFITELAAGGYNKDQIMAEFEKKFWSEKRGRAQPKAAFLENAKHTIDVLCKE